MSPPCGKPVRYYELNRPRNWIDPAPVCGRPAGHPEGTTGRHLSAETYARYKETHRIAAAAKRARLRQEAS